MKRITEWEIIGVGLFLDALADYLREHPDAGPMRVMRDIPEINLLAGDGRAIRLYREAARRAVTNRLEEPYSLSRVRKQIILAQQMV